MNNGEGNTPGSQGVLSVHFPNGLVSCFSKQNHGAEILTAKELHIARHFEPLRRQSFINGRYCAHRCLRAFGEMEQVTVDDHGVPVWPPHFTGSISHSKQLAGALLTRQSCYISVGLDIEEIGRIDRDLWCVLFVPTEQSFLRKLSPHQQRVFSTVIFSIKEAYFKMQFPMTHLGLEPTDIEVIIDQKFIHIRLNKHFIRARPSPLSLMTGYYIEQSSVISYALLVQDDMTLCF